MPTSSFSLALNARGALFGLFSDKRPFFYWFTDSIKRALSAPRHPTRPLFFFSNPPNSSTTSKNQKSKNQDCQFDFLSWLSATDIATSWTRSRRVDEREVNNHLPRFRAVTRRGQTGRRWFYNQEKKHNTKNLLHITNSYPRTPFFALCLHYILRTREREELEANRKRAATERYVFFLSIASYQLGGEKRRVQVFLIPEFLAYSYQLWIMRQRMR